MKMILNNKFCKIFCAFILILTLTIPAFAFEFCHNKEYKFVHTGNMNIARTRHSATLLENGNVIIIGGIGKDDDLYSAEIYDHNTGKFILIGNMAVARHGHTATLLKDGRVLIIGGHNAISKYNEINDVEIYDPRSNKFNNVAKLDHLGNYHTSTLLNNGKVLVIARNDTDTHAILFDPKNNNFDPISKPLNRSGEYTATLLLNGKVLIVGGNLKVNRTAEIYDPNTGTFTLTGSLNKLRNGHSATLLPDGKVIIIAGDYTYSQENNKVLPSTMEVFDYNTGKFTITGNIKKYRSNQSSILLPQGNLVIIGGEPYPMLYPGINVFNLKPATGELIDTKTCTVKSIKTLHFWDSGVQATLLNNYNILITGGDLNSSINSYIFTF